MRVYGAVTDLVFSDETGECIDCRVDFEGIGVVPFRASARDVEIHGIEIYERALVGDFGAVAPFVRPVIPLETLRAAKIATLRAACAAEIVGGFSSEALGAAHVYPSGQTDQINLMGSVTASILPGVAEGWTTPFWCAGGGGEWAYRAHTASQIQAVGADGKAHVVGAQTRLAMLSAEVEGAVTADAVTAISWE